MKEIEIKVTLQVDSDGTTFELTDHLARKAALQAIDHAVRHCEGEGFVHDLADDVSIGVAEVEVLDVS